ncbi:reverse transcriptase domain-containing protein [Legionella cardiaca]|uniref:RNA-directed DNA polymerase n=1 Tax=Legionella cardiaca TaxID=1071983 RepID=A0ABY8AS77_9GAMM|nr:reverse transcriptase domain-containing protein [Legionella cardiaca]WED43378.1 reverse transcriptase domain-containing protein [Legionella cardiaca]
MDKISFKDCLTVKDLSRFLGMDYSQLSSMIYPSTSSLYITFIIPKKSGSDRIIDAPKAKLKSIQRALVKEFNQIYLPRINAHGFICKRSIITNAKHHINKKYVFNLDLKDFFPSIHFGRVRNLFMSNLFSFTYEVATVLAHICCHNGRLPQGAPTSPVLTNMIAFKLDNELLKLSIENKCSFTRYVDDLTFSFSCQKNKLPPDIICLNGDENITPGNKLQKIIEKNGFEINLSKCRLHHVTQSQKVTGIVVNNKTNVQRGFINKTRSMLYAWERFGLEAGAKEYITSYLEKDYGTYDKKRILSEPSAYFNLVIKGRINYIGMVRGNQDSIYKKLLYKYSVLNGEPDENLKKTSNDILADSIFIVEHSIEGTQGTAFLVDKLGLVTVWHVVEGVTSETSCFLDFFRFYDSDIKRKAVLHNSSKSKDLAIFKFSNNFQGIVPLKLGDSAKLKQGDEIKLIGFPSYNIGDHYHCNMGKITQRKKVLGINVWLIDIPITHGISGGPVLNSNDEVIGIATVGSEKHDSTTISHGFIPIADALKLL